MNKIHYFYDPMCGWCYGATTLISALNNFVAENNWQVVMHPGGIIARRAIENGFHQHILSADEHIARLTKAEFGENYRARVASSQPLVLDSMLPTQAILAAKTCGKDEFTMLKAIQSAHYQQGLDVSEEATLQQIAKDLGIADSDWQNAMQDAAAQLRYELQQSHQHMNQLGVQGFPTLIMETDKGLQRLPHSQFYGKPDN
ncbi:MAG: protein-disulfide isomerase [Oleibacter sp.]|nr:protein-disulfide isomerase [Thalassolituus sp.]